MMARAFVYIAAICGLAVTPVLAQPLAPQMPPPGSGETAIGSQPPAPVPLVPLQPAATPPAQTDAPPAGPFIEEAPAAEIPEVDENVQEEMARALPGGDAAATDEAEAAAAPATEAEEPALPFDVQPFLSAMVELRGAAQTCAPFVGDNPLGRTDTIPQFFTMLGQELPELTNETTQASLRRFIGSQAAMLCVDMLNGAFASYAQAAISYEAQKPEAWPPPPPVQPGMWCAQPFCLDR